MTEKITVSCEGTRSSVSKNTLRKWVAALRSKEFTQGAGRLQNNEGHCCLGVACRIFISSDKLDLHEDGRLQGEMPSDQTKSPKWLIAIDKDFKRKYGRSPQNLNDRGFSFRQIANRIEKVYKL